jgi:hypothetical protein
MVEHTLWDGRELRDRGIDKAVKHAELKDPHWKEKAYRFLVQYIDSHGEFMAEDVRMASSGVVPVPPSKRAWGGVIVRAARKGLIERVGFRSVKNAKAHCTPAAVWRRT